MYQVTPRSFTVDYLRSLEFVTTDQELIAREFDVTPENVVKTSKQDDILGCDYTFINEVGHIIGIDVKRREKGASKYWRDNHPDVAIELGCGVVPGPLFRRTLPSAMFWMLAYADLPDDVYVFSSRALTSAARRHVSGWVRDYGVKSTPTLNKDGSTSWTRVVYVPLATISAAVDEAFTLPFPK